MNAAQRPVVGVLTRLEAGELERLRTIATVVQAASVAEIPEPRRAACRAVILRSETDLRAPQLALLPALTDVVRPGSGCDNIAVDLLAERAIRLHRSAAVSAEAVAELAVAGLTVLCRQMARGYRLLLEGTYAKHRLMGEATARQRVTVWGAGPVGTAVFDRLTAAGAVAAYVRHPSVPAGAPTVPQDEALAGSDVHVLALPLREGTRGKVGAAWLERAAARRPYLVNVGRLELMDLDAVAGALRADGLRGCYLDPVNPDQAGRVRAFLDAAWDANVFVTQHQGAQRSDVRATLDAWAVDRIREFVESEAAAGGG
ncbi:hypothetical protein KGA66_17330 [Actinocrinis puniceicyclus]|uniref:D-isomer specific 2-hydroxyacid dehydrogenase NAD-binding domain-containing protein n=1 Tax=Actinocrinis puniceicyclus TaxID=977794 RepID=A0A8J8BD30_9ACTN|nr:NAD(P)-dependent oxidoreductase [Actinocrinis puniceicyclus]MBS2964823.1 hypothetical protein [Actinocrinis puniceicyclus]